MLARNLLPALMPLLVVGRDRASPLPAARRLGTVLGAALLAYSLGFCVWVSFSPDLQRPDWDAVAARLGEPEAPRATVTWTLGEAPLRHYLSTGAMQVQRRRRLRLARPRSRLRLRRQGAAAAGTAARARLPRNRASEDAGRLFIRRYRLPGPGLAPLRLAAAARRADLDFRNTGVLLDGVGPG